MKSPCQSPRGHCPVWAWIDSVSFNKCQHDLALQPLCLARWGEGGAGSMWKCGRGHFFSSISENPHHPVCWKWDYLWVTGLQGACECMCMSVCCLVTVCGRLSFFPPNGLIRQCLWSILGIKVSLA